MRLVLRFGQFHVALVALGAMAGAAAVLGIPLVPAAAVLGSLGAWTVYVAERLAADAPEDALNHPERTAWLARHRRGLWMLVVVLGLVCAGAWGQLPRPAQAAAVGLGGQGGLYLWPRLRRWAWAKTGLVALAWGGGVVLLPALAAGGAGAVRTGALVAAQALLVAANALLLDAVDMRGDRATGRRTLAGTLSPAAYRVGTGTVLALSAVVQASLVGGLGGRGLLTLLPHAVLAVAVARLPALTEHDGGWIDLAVGLSGLAYLL